VLAILKAVDDPDVTPQVLARLIEKDPALAAQLLRIVNSPYFGIHHEVTSLTQAAAFLGTGGIRTMSLAFSLSQGLLGKTSAKRGVDDILKRSVLSAAIARELSHSLSIGDPEVAFLTALLQDIGILALRETLGTPYEALQGRCGRDHLLLIDQERELLGTDHTDVGAWLLGNWGLPRIFQAVVRASHGASEKDSEALWKRLGSCVHAAGLLGEIWLGPLSQEEIAVRLPQAAGILEVEEIQLKAVLEKVAEVLPDVLALFEIASVMDDFEGILEEVRQSVLVSSLQDIIQVREKDAALLSLSAEVSQLRQDVVKDPLTGVFNRQYFEDSLDRLYRDASERGGSLCVCFCDLDHFKLINDNLGHLYGDRVLKQAASILAGEVRSEDCVCRYGGDEFVLLLPGTDGPKVRTICERLRERFASEILKFLPETTLRPTLSIGYAVLDARTQFPTSRSLVNAADQALYQAKGKGRNCVVVFGEDPETAPDKGIWREGMPSAAGKTGTLSSGRRH